MSKKKRGLRYPCTDAGNAELLAAVYGEVLRFDHQQGRWLIWNKRRDRWIEDHTNEVRNYAIQTARRRRRIAAGLGDSEKAKLEIRWSFESENRYKIDAALGIAQSLPPISDVGNDWDRDGWLFGARNGVIDLRTGKLRPEQSLDRITKHSPVNFAPDARCPSFLKFLDQIFNADTELIDYVQRMAGYCLTGSVKEQCVFCWHGVGANGKTTLSVILGHILGDYAVNLPFSALELKNRNSNDLVALAGARLATASETNEGMRLNEARIKVLTGGDPLTARKLYHESFTFDPTHKLVLAFNHKPVIADDSQGMWRRVRLIPFTRQLKPEEQDPDLLDALKSEAPGILSWAVKGCLLWQQKGLGMPIAVAAATSAYREESDHLGEFIDDCCELGQSATATSGALWRRYQAWVLEHDEVALSRQVFAGRLEKRGIHRDRIGRGGTRAWVGIGLHENIPAQVTDCSYGGDVVTNADTVSNNSLTSEAIEKFAEST